MRLVAVPILLISLALSAEETGKPVTVASLQEEIKKKDAIIEEQKKQMMGLAALGNAYHQKFQQCDLDLTQLKVQNASKEKK